MTTDLKTDPPAQNTAALLDRLHDMVETVNATNATNEKIEHLRQYTDLRPFLKLLMDPLETTGVSRKKIEDYGKKRKAPSKAKAQGTKKRKTEKDHTVSSVTSSSPFTEDLTQLLRKLYTREYSGHEAKEAVLHMVSLHPKHTDLIYKVVEKNLETRLGVKQLNAAFPNLIPQFEVALAEDYYKKKSYFDKNQDKTWLISRKFDGIRVIAKHTENGTTCYSRKGHPFPALKLLEDMITQYVPSGWIFDGEVCVVDDKGNEDFTEAVSQVKRKSVLMKKFRYYVFDVLTLDEFEALESSEKLSTRIQRWDTLMADFPHKDAICKVTQVPYSPTVLEERAQYALDHGWEGLMLRMDAPYKGKRSNDILKYKNFETEEYKVKDVEFGPMRIIDEESGLETTIDTLKSVVIQHKGFDVNVGSGFKLEQRKMYYENPALILNKEIAVQYFEETTDSKGKISLRFPTFKGFYGEKREV